MEESVREGNRKIIMKKRRDLDFEIWDVGLWAQDYPTLLFST
jgi:hypothetical protein